MSESGKRAKHDAFKHIGPRIALARERRNLSKTQLAKAAGLNRSTISRIEAGNGDLRLSSLIAIARVLHVRARDLVKPD